MSEQRGLKALESWAKRVTNGYNGVNVRDMSLSFRDGLAFCAIIHHYYPELIDFDSLSKENILHNNSLAFSVAEKKLGVPALLDAEDMVQYAVPDRLSIATYLSQLRNCFENQNRVNKVRPVKRVSKEGQSELPVKIFGDTKISTPRSHETCNVCKHRVFLLERLMVSGKLYHRTCFKCSKCDTLLKPGAYVESDVTGSYECAICPRDEKKRESKPSDEKSISDNEISNGIDLSNNSSPAVSPLSTPKLPVLSTKLNNARNDFLQRSISDKKQEQNFSSSSKSSSSESLSRASDHPAFDDSPLNLDSGFKEESASEDLSCETPKFSIETEKESVRKSLPTSPIRPLGLKTDIESNGARKPYQSIFTRELLHATSLKSISTTRSSDITPISSMGLKTLSNSKLTADIPLIRSTSYTTTTLHPGENKSSSSSGPQAGSRHSDHSLNGSINHKWSGNLRRSSLDTSGQQNVHNSKVDESISLRHGSDQNISASTASEHDKSSVSNSVLDFKTRRLEKPKEEFSSGTSVRQLIQLREASIHESKTPHSAYKRSSTLSTNAKVPDHVESPSHLETKYLSNEHSEKAVTEQSRITTDEIIQEPSDEVTVIPKPRRKSRSQSYEDSSSTAVSDKLDSKVSANDHSKVLLEPEDSKALFEQDDSKVSVEQDDSHVSVDQIDSKVSVEQDDSHVSVDQIDSKVSVEQKEKIEVESQKSVQDTSEYPEDFNPFGDEDDASNPFGSDMYPDDLNPFGDDDDDDSKPVKDAGVRVNIISSSYDESKNPFASDDEEEYVAKPPPVPRTPIKTPVPTTIASKSPPCQQTLPRSNNVESPTGSVRGTLKKRPAPKPPHVKDLFLNTSLGSETSLSTLDSTTSPSKLSPSPKIRKNKRAPPPPPSPSVSLHRKNTSSSPSPVKDADQKSLSAGSEDSSGNTWKKKKRPAPPVPIPKRREIKKIPLHEIKAEMSEIEEKQMELENQGRELEVLIRDRDKEEEPTVEEEEYIMQLFELVNQKNALFRRQAELMYIKRSQRLEEEQVELEFQIRCLMNKPKSQKNEEDKSREEKLVQQLLDVVDQRNEIVDSIEMDRRREAEEDVSVQEQMEIKTGDLPIAAEIKKKSEKKEKKHKEKKKKKKKLKEGKTEDQEVEAVDKKGTIRKKWF